MKRLIVKLSVATIVAVLSLVSSTMLFAGDFNIIQYNDFSSLTDGVLSDSTSIGGGNNQGDWYLDANNGQFFWGVGTVVGGLYDGHKELLGSGRSFNAYSDSFFKGLSGEIAYEFTFRINTNGWAGVNMLLLGDGTMSADVSYTIYMNHFSPRLAVNKQTAMDTFYFALSPVPEDGSSWSGITESVSGLDVADYYSVRVVILPDAYDGQGSATVYYRNVSDDGDWIKVGGLVEDCNIRLDRNKDGYSFADWNQVYFKGDVNTELLDYTVSYKAKGTVVVIE
jgi:hypothetical protein